VTLGNGAIRILVASARLQVLAVRSHPALMIATVIQPAALYLIVTSDQSVTPARRFPELVAVLLTSLWSATLWTAGGTLRREIREGTFSRNLTSVSDPRIVVIGKCLGSNLLVLAALLVTGSVLGVLAGVRVPAQSAPWIAGGLVLVALSGTAMGYVLCSVFILTRHAVHVTAALTYPVFLLSGLMIPLSMLPGPLAWASRLISLYWANLLLSGDGGGDLRRAGSAAAVVVLTAAYYAAGHILFRRVVARVRRTGRAGLA
jgi:ABC-2 type transport system permease protein